MRKYLLLALFGCGYLWAQNNVGIGTATPNANALLDLTATNKGFLLPRMTTAQRVAMAAGMGAPEKSMLVFDNTDNNFYYWDGAAWQLIRDYDWIINGNDQYSGVPGNVGIGTTTPSAKLHVNGTVRFQGLATGLFNDVLVTDANGNVFYRNLPANVWDGDDVNDADADPANELNSSLTFNTTTNVLSLTDVGGTLTATIQTSDITDIVAGDGLTGGGNTGIVTLNAAANNGLTVNAAADMIQLGGNLIQPTTVTTSGNALNLNATAGGNVVLQGNGTAGLTVNPNAQVLVGTGAANANSIFQINSTTKGMQFPRMTTAQRNAIPVAAGDEGITVYNTTTQTHQYWNGVCWLNVGDAVCTDFSIAAAPNSGCIYTTSASSQDVVCTVTLNSGTAVPVLLGVSGLPAGITISWSSNPVVPTQATVATITGSAAAVPGVYPLTFMAIYGSNIQTATYNLQVVGTVYNVSATAGTINEINVAPNTTTATTNINVALSGVCAGANITTLSTTGVPTGVTATFSTNPIVGTGASVLTFTGSSCAEPGIYNVTITAMIGTVPVNTAYTLTIAPSIINIAANTSNYNLFVAAGSPPCDVDLDCHILPGVVVSSGSTGSSAFNSGAFASGSIINLINDGAIIGRGGDGGTLTTGGGSNCPDADGKAGGNALELNMQNLFITNNGFIGGGGGGGGAGGSLSAANLCLGFRQGAGGGGGAGSGVGGANVCGGPGANGAVAGPFAPGAGGGLGGTGCGITCTIGFCPFCINGNENSGNGGPGGGYGQPGTDGSDPSFLDFVVCSRGIGGAAGGWLKTNGFVYSIVTPGTVAGPIVP